MLQQQRSGRPPSGLPPAVSRTVQLAPFGTLTPPPVQLAYPSQERIIQSVTINNESNGTIAAFVDANDTVTGTPTFTCGPNSVKTMPIGGAGKVLFGFVAPSQPWTGSVFLQVSQSPLAASSGSVSLNSITVSGAILDGSGSGSLATVDASGNLFTKIHRDYLDVVYSNGNVGGAFDTGVLDVRAYTEALIHVVCNNARQIFIDAHFDPNGQNVVAHVVNQTLSANFNTLYYFAPGAGGSGSLPGFLDIHIGTINGDFLTVSAFYRT